MFGRERWPFNICVNICEQRFPLCKTVGKINGFALGSTVVRGATSARETWTWIGLVHRPIDHGFPGHGQGFLRDAQLEKPSNSLRNQYTSQHQDKTGRNGRT